ncbi:hypothetical protein C8R44DRAFT_808702 [Mycena epipterygia]|nr:hypothetical protein C8R44DRAFT_808702 [Mycena epipterygia]
MESSTGLESNLLSSKIKEAGSVSEYLEALYARAEADKSNSKTYSRSRKEKHECKAEPDDTAADLNTGILRPKTPTNEIGISLIPNHHQLPNSVPTPPSLLRLAKYFSPSPFEPRSALHLSTPTTLSPFTSQSPSPLHAHDTALMPTATWGEFEFPGSGLPSLPVKPEESHIDPILATPACSNCHRITNTSRAGRSRRTTRQDSMLCTVCSIYQQTHGRALPVALKSRPRERWRTLECTSHREVQECSNCDSTTTSGWYKSKLGAGGKLCKACYEYESRRHCARPLALERARAQRADQLVPKKRK